MLRCILCCWALLLGGAAGAAARIDVDALAIPQQSFTLANGLRVVVHEDRSTPVVAVHLWYQVGSRDERRGRTGFAHLFEHFFFNGSEHYPHGFREAMDELGANNRNGTTSTDRTNFFEDVPTSALERTLYLEADRMGFLAGNLSPAMLERERGVVQNEKRQGENQPYGTVFQRILAAVYPPEHPYSWSTIGSMEDLRAASLDDIREWYSTWYGPGNAVLALAGDISLEEARRLVEKYFGDIAPGAPIARLQSWTPALASSIRDRQQSQVPNSRLYRVWHTAELGERDAHALELLAEIYAGMPGSPLRRQLMINAPLASDVASFVRASELAGLWVTSIDVKAGADPAAAEAAMESALASLLDTGPEHAALERARTRLLGAFARESERIGGRAAVLARSVATTGSADGYLQRLHDLQTLDAASVRAAGQRWLRRPHYTLLVEPVPPLRAEAGRVDRRQLPALGAAPALRFPAVQRGRLSNGIEVLLLQRASPLVQLAVRLDAGSAVDPPDARGLGRLALRTMLKGTRQHPDHQLLEAYDELGVRIRVDQASDQSLLILDTLAGTFEHALPLLAETLQAPAFAQNMLEAERRQQLADIAREAASPLGAAQRVALPLLYGAQHPYAQGPEGLGDAAAVASSTEADLRRWHADWVVPARTTLVVAGPIPLDRLLPLLEQGLGSWSARSTAVKAEFPAAPAEAPSRIVLVDRPGAPQSLIYAAQTGPAGAQPDDLASEVVLRNFGGIATSRLNRNLRLDKHWSYGSTSGLTEVRGPRLYTVVAPVQTDRTAAAMREVRKEILGLAGERPLQGAEFRGALSGQLARLPARYEALDALLTAGIGLIQMQRDDRWYADYSSRMQALTAAELNAAAARLVRPEALLWVVVGDLKRIEPYIRALDWGVVERLGIE